MARALAATGAVSPEGEHPELAAGPGARLGASSLVTQTVTAQGSRFDPGQTYRVTDPSRFVQTFQFTRTHDLLGHRVRTEWNRAPGYPGQVPFIYGELAGPRGGYFDAPRNFQDLLSGVAQHGMTPATVDATQRNRELYEPHQLLAEMLAHPERVSSRPSVILDQRRAYVLALAREVSPVQLFLDAATFLPIKAARLEDDAVLGDASVEVRYQAWTQAQGLQVPTSFTTTIDGQLVQREQRTQVHFARTTDAGQFDVPAALTVPYDPVAARTGDAHSQLFDRGLSFGFEMGERLDTVTMTRLAPGIFHVTGGTHHSLAIETDHGIVVVEAPNDEVRSQAVLAALAAQFGSKPISYVINTHHHHDHVGGLRTYAARGIPVVAPAVDLPFLRGVMTTAHRLHPDLLEQHPRPATLVGVGAQGWSYTDGRTIEVIPVTSDHAETSLVVYVPDARLLFESDFYFPTFFPIDQPTPGPFGATTRQLYQALVLDRGLDVQLVAGGHAGVASGEVFRINAGF